MLHLKWMLLLKLRKETKQQEQELEKLLLKSKNF